MLKTITPIDNTLFIERKFASTQEINNALKTAKKFFFEWSNTALIQIKKILTNFVDIFLKNNAEIEEELCKQMGRPISQCNEEMKGFEERSRYMIEKSEEALENIVSKKNNEFDNFISKDLLGTIFIVAPWNYPYNASVNSVVPSLLSVNLVILKHSSQKPLCAEQLFKAVKLSGLPEGVFQFLHLDHISTSKIISDKRIDHVLFTGSVIGGRQVKKAIGERFINAGLELGGKDPAYVRKDCNIQHAIENLTDGSFYNSGQSCCGIERIYVDAEVYDEFVDGVKNLTEKYILDNPLKIHTSFGSVVKLDAAQRIFTQIKKTIASGVKNIVGKENFKISEDNNCYVSPSVLINVDHSMKFMMEETFGPAVGIMKVKNENEAAELMN